MSHRKNLTAEDLSRKFNCKVTDGDLTPAFNKDSRYLNEMADLSALASELAAKVPALPEEKKKDPEEKKETPPPAEPEKTFAELFEGRSARTAGAPEKKTEEKRSSSGKKIVELCDDADFGKLFRASSMKIVDKDAVAVPDRDCKPFEITEEEAKTAKREFHGFEDLANAFSSGRKGRK